MSILKNRRHEKFCQAVFAGKSQRQAAVDAGYKPTTARNAAYYVAHLPDVKARIQELLQEATSACIMSVTKRKEKLSEIARADLTDFLTENGVKAERGMPNTGAIQGVSTRVKCSKKGVEAETVTDIKLHGVQDEIQGTKPPNPWFDHPANEVPRESSLFQRSMLFRHIKKVQSPIFTHQWCCV
jgi:phage terminase small subunit